MFKFEDFHEFNGSSHYPCTNEDAQILRNMIKGIPAQKIGGICGGGDIGFNALLPSVRGELILIDHSYSSLCAALLKYLMFEKYSAKKIKHLFTKDPKELHSIVEKLLKQLPEHPKDPYNRGIFVHKYQGRFNYVSDLARIWTKITEKDIKEIQRKLELITFLHGDLDDLFKRGPFDIIYTSNALTFQGRNKTKTDITKLKAALKPKGYVLTCNSTHDIPGLTELKSVSGYPDTHWRYLLLQKTE